MTDSEKAFETVRAGILHKTVGHDSVDIPADAALDALSSIQAALREATDRAEKAEEWQALREEQALDRYRDRNRAWSKIRELESALYESTAKLAVAVEALERVVTWERVYDVPNDDDPDLTAFNIGRLKYIARTALQRIEGS